ncbi:NUDIX hydrolase [bacterium]|nr:MAG: NUDIX hydrolase [bacterium]
MDGPAVEQQLLGQRGLARVRVRDNGESTACRDRLVQVHNAPTLREGRPAVKKPGAMDGRERRWHITQSEVVIDTPWLRLRRDQIDLPSGRTIADYYVRESRGFVVIFALTPSGEVPLVRQYKHGIGEMVLELPAGMIDPGETPSAAAARELREETGYVAPALEHVATFLTDPTHSDSRMHLFLARDAVSNGHQDLDPTEEIDVELVPLEALDALLDDGSIAVSHHVAAIYTILHALRGERPHSPRTR